MTPSFPSFACWILCSYVLGFGSLVGQSAQQWTRKAKELSLQGEYAAAAEAYEAALQGNRRSAENHFYQGICYFELGQHEKALRSFTWAIAIRPGVALYHDYRGRSRVEVGEFEAAMADYDLAVRQAGALHRGEYLYHRGLCHAHLGDHVAAIADFDRAISQDDRIGDYFRSRGECKLAIEEQAGACADFQAALERHAFNARYLIDTYCQD
ncbi:MAG: tetratricopeptide repeat protein [Bacteroidota bacterium]